MFIIREKTTEEGQSPRYMHCITLVEGYYSIVFINRKSGARAFDTKDEAARFLERHGLFAEDCEIEEANE